MYASVRAAGEYACTPYHTHTHTHTNTHTHTSLTQSTLMLVHLAFLFEQLQYLVMWTHVVHLVSAVQQCNYIGMHARTHTHDGTILRGIAHIIMDMHANMHRRQEKTMERVCVCDHDLSQARAPATIHEVKHAYMYACLYEACTQQDTQHAKVAT